MVIINGLFKCHIVAMGAAIRLDWKPKVEIPQGTPWEEVDWYCRGRHRSAKSAENSEMIGDGGDNSWTVIETEKRSLKNNRKK